ncbi:MAG: TlyA family RNA methyltransferase [Candidatus Eremiobacteraeota bacterium]|nr:TlyA family RNA methyltransferase [Candidatus Eremiobacteraeota bacterium]
MSNTKKTKKQRLDNLVINNGFADTKSKAQAMIMAGIIKVADRIATKSGTFFPEDVEITLIKPPHPYSGRGGLKLEKAIDEFHIDVKGKTCIDAGASTGGFTSCLLLMGAKKVYAIDVGHGQIDYKLRNDERVIVLEKCNVRYLSNEHVPEKVDIITADLSFISLKKVIELLKDFLKPGGIFIPLIKPQFEAERKYCRKGIIRDADIRKSVVDDIVRFTELLGFKCIGVTESPIKGPKGNVEFTGCFILES